MTEKELKKIHGADVELGVDDSEDEKLTEKQALARAKKEGLVPVDTYVVLEGFTEIEEYETEAEAKKALKKGQVIAQKRRMVEAK